MAKHNKITYKKIASCAKSVEPKSPGSFVQYQMQTGKPSDIKYAKSGGCRQSNANGHHLKTY